MGAYFKKYVSQQSITEVHSLKDTPVLPSSYIMREEGYQKDYTVVETIENSASESQKESTPGNELSKILEE